MKFKPQEQATVQANGKKQLQDLDGEFVTIVGIHEAAGNPEPDRCYIVQTSSAVPGRVWSCYVVSSENLKPVGESESRLRSWWCRVVDLYSHHFETVDSMADQTWWVSNYYEKSWTPEESLADVLMKRSQGLKEQALTLNPNISNRFLS